MAKKYMHTVMTPIESIYTAVRRYCREQKLFWHQQYSELNRRHCDSGTQASTEEKNTIIPRCAVLEAILPDLERMTVEDFRSVEEVVEWLLLVGELSQNSSTQLPWYREENAIIAMRDERAHFARFVREFAAQPKEVEPLPYRRTLSDGETRVIWSALAERWGVNPRGYWYPFSDVNPSSVIVLGDNCVTSEQGQKGLQQILLLVGARRVFELPDTGPDPCCEIDVLLVDGLPGMIEAYWTPPELDWLLYASHNETLTFAGERLVESVKSAWPDYESHLYERYS